MLKCLYTRMFPIQIVCFRRSYSNVGSRTRTPLTSYTGITQLLPMNEKNRLLLLHKMAGSIQPTIQPKRHSSPNPSLRCFTHFPLPVAHLAKWSAGCRLLCVHQAPATWSRCRYDKNILTKLSTSRRVKSVARKMKGREAR